MSRTCVCHSVPAFLLQGHRQQTLTIGMNAAEAAAEIIKAPIAVCRFVYIACFSSWEWLPVVLEIT